eukprot:scaffold226246_cov30-Tisochrysis_lutea.AAC.2
MADANPQDFAGCHRKRCKPEHYSPLALLRAPLHPLSLSHTLKFHFICREGLPAILSRCAGLHVD